MHRPLRPLRRLALVVGLGVAAGACEPMESRGDPFAPAPKPAPPAAATPAAPDPAFDFPSEPPLVLTSEQLAGGDLAGAMAEAAGVDPAEVAPEEPAAAPAPAAPEAAPAPPPPPPVGVPAATQWPVRLVSTIPQAQPPRAILGLSSGEERVVSPGSILAAEGLVVMAVTADRVQLAKIVPAGDHATITSIELSAQYPSK